LPDLVLDYHRLKIPLDHSDSSVVTAKIADLAVTRTKLEYPTVNVNIVYLLARGKAHRWRSGTDWCGHVTDDVFTDKGIEAIVFDGAYGTVSSVFARTADGGNAYHAGCNSTAEPTADFIMHKVVAGTVTRIGYEAVDLPASRSYLIKMTWSGSTGKGFREDMVTAKFSVTDTSIASGFWGVGSAWSRGSALQDAILRSPSSPLPQALAVVEVETVGDGSTENPFRPLMSENLVDVSELQNVPDFLRLEKRKYDILKYKGFTEEEMKILLGYVPQHQVDLDSVSWGAFEFSERSPTNIIVVTSDNPYRPGAINRQIKFVQERGLRTLRSPRDYNEAVSQYNKLRSDFKHWLAGKDNYAYQVLGWEEFEVFAVADFYYGELVEHKTYYDQLKRVPDWELERVLNTWLGKLESVTVLTEERDKHINKLREVLKLGW